MREILMRSCETLAKRFPLWEHGVGKGVHVISYKAIREYKGARPDAGPALDNWYRVSSACQWTSFAEVKQVLGSADWVKPYVVFNITGNKYRLIAEINFRSQTLFIRHILTHQEYSEGKWKKG